MKIKIQENLPSNKSEMSTVLQCKTEIIPIMDALYIINGKWRIPITITLMEGNKRFGEIQKDVHKITSKVLAHELKEMELNGFVEKKIYDESPVRTEYELTDYSWSIETIITALRDFGVQHRKKIRDENFSRQ